jgi:Galactose oxidase, central domain
MLPLQRAASLVLSASLAASCAAGREPAGPAPIGEASSALTAPTWTATGAMSTARESHTATLLPDGRVLVAGGNGTQTYASAELYHPGSMSFSLAGPMTAQRSGHFAVLLGTGDVLVAGGDGTAADAETYDPTTGAWAPAGTLSQPRSGAAGALLHDGRVLLTGGPDATADLYDPSMHTWSPAAPMSIPRSGHTATLLPDGSVLVAGGTTAQGSATVTTASAEIYDPVTGLWSPAKPLLAARAQHTATALADGRVLVTGGTSQPGADSFSELASAEAYDPTLDAWQSAPSMTTPRALHTATLLDNDAVLVTGGLDRSDSALPTAELFALGGTSVPLPWHAIEPMTATRIGHTATLLDGGAVLVAGGEQQSSAELFQLGKNGDACAIPQECASTFCSDGVCCETACTSSCHSCAQADSTGTCTQVKTGTDPRGDCGSGEACDRTCGANATCESRVGAPCTAGGCSADGKGAFAAATCAAGSTTCPMPVVPCAPAYLCDEDAGACRTACGSVRDCAEGYACDLSGQCVQAGGDADSGGAPSCDVAMIPAGAGGVAGLLASGALAGAARRRARRRRKGVK